MSQYSRSPRNMSRRQRRELAARLGSGVVTGHPTGHVASLPRRSYSGEPAPMDYSTEFRYVRKDLMRILVWAFVLIAAMLVLWFIPATHSLAQLFG